MRGNEFLNKMELIDPAYVEAAETKTIKPKGAWLKWIATAACLCLVVGSVVVLNNSFAPKDTDTPDPFNTGAQGLYPADNSKQPVATPPTLVETPPAVSLSPDALTIPALQVAAGFEGYMCYDISELANGNPWSEDMNITSLPVYKNLTYDATGAGVPRGMSEEEMMTQLNSVMFSLNLTVTETEVIKDSYVEKDGEWVIDDTPTGIKATTNNGEITIDADGSIEYRLTGDGLALPATYHFTNNYTTDEEAAEVLSYFIEEYKAHLNWEEPVANIYGDYDIFGNFFRNYSIYDASGNDAEHILNYNFFQIQFYPNEQGNLTMIRMKNSLENAEKIKDYPIINLQEATKRLCNGNYQTSVPLAFPGEESIGKVELVYRTGRLEELYLPYYRFYVLLPDSFNTNASDRGLKTYGIYYVPALPDEYIVNMPTYDGSFN